MPDETLTDPLGRAIILSDHRWFGHIVAADGHPEMLSHRELVKQAITAPMEIQFSATNANCRVYYGVGPRATVLVTVVADVSAGFVKTAFFVRKMRAGVVEWQPSP